MQACNECSSLVVTDRCPWCGAHQAWLRKAWVWCIIIALPFAVLGWVGAL